MKKNMKWMNVVTALAIVAWGAVPAGADDSPAPFWTFATSFDEDLILGETFESLNVGDPFDAGPLGVVGAADGTMGEVFLVANDNPDLNGNHLDGDSAGEGIQNVFSFDDSPADHGAPTTGTYYIEGTVDSIEHNTSVGVYNAHKNTSYAPTYYDHSVESGNAGFGRDGWGSDFGPNDAAFSGYGVFDPENPHRLITAVNIETGYVLSYSFLAVDLVTGNSWGHGGETGVPNHIPGFGTPTLRVYYDRRREPPQNIDMDDFRIATSAWIPPLIPEPATFALLGLGSLLMLRRRV